jgi:hypothetical protein
MKRGIGLVLILFLTVARGLAAEPPGGTGSRKEPLRMEELEVWGNAPLRMEDLEVRGFRETPDVLYLPVHRGIALPAPVRYDLFLEDMEKPVFPRDISPQKRPAGRTFDR